MPTYRKTPEALARLSPEQYRVTQQSGTEAPGSGELLDNHEPGFFQGHEVMMLALTGDYTHRGDQSSF